MGCKSSKDKDPSLDMEDSEATESVRRRQNSKVKMRTAKTQEELDEACEDLFLDCDDEMTQMHPGEWDCDDDFEYVDADYVHPVSASGAPSEGFDPNDEDSIREHYILRDDAEWVGPAGAPKCGSFPGITRCDVKQMGGNTWCPGYGESFNLRVGPNYKKYGKKSASREAIYSVVSMDVMRSNPPIHHIASKMQLPKVDFTVNSQYVKPILVVNIILPLTGPDWTFSTPSDGPSLQMVAVMVMKEKYAKMFDHLQTGGAYPAIHQLEEYMRVAPEENEDGCKADTYRWRWKFIGRAEGKLPSLIKSWNGKPALITKDGRLHRGNGYVEMDINVAEWCKMARSSLNSMFCTVPERALSIAHVIESREDEHMPEQTLACMQIDCLECFTDDASIYKDHPDLLDANEVFK